MCSGDSITRPTHFPETLKTGTRHPESEFLRNLEGRFGSFLPPAGERDGSVFCRMSRDSAVSQLYVLRHITTFHSKPQFSQVQNGYKDSPQESPSERGLARGRCRTQTWSDPLHSLPSCCQAVLPLSKLPLTPSLASFLLSCVGCHGHSPHHAPAHRSAPPLTERAIDKGPSLIFVFSTYSHRLQHTYYVPASWKTSDKCVLTEFIQHLLQREDLLSPCTSTCSEQHKSYLKCVAGIPWQSSG